MKVQFKIIIYSNNKDYLVNYLPSKKKMEVIEQLKVIADGSGENPWMHIDFKEALTLSYESVILTPHNVQEKLPLLLLLS